MKNVLTSVLGMGDATLNKVRDSVVLFWFAMCPPVITELAFMTVIFCYSLKCNVYSDKIFCITGD